MDDLNEDCLFVVLSYLTVTEKVNCQRVCSKWQQVVARLLNAQKVLGNAPSNQCDRCLNRRHWISRNDLISKELLTNLSLLPRILAKCPDLRAIAVTRPKELTFGEAAYVKRQAYDREQAARAAFLGGKHWGLNEKMDEDEGEEDEVDEEGRDGGREEADGLQHLLHGCVSDLEMPSGSRRRDSFSAPMSLQSAAFSTMTFSFRSMRANKRRKPRRPPSPRPTNEEDFLDVLAKYAPRLECVNVCGLKLGRGYRAEADEAGSWKLIAARCGQTLVHLKTRYMRDRELSALLASCPSLKEICVTYGVTGQCLSQVCPGFEKLAVGSLQQPGLSSFLEADLGHLKELSLNSVNGEMVNMLCSHLHSLEALVMMLSMHQISAFDLSKIGSLKNLKRLDIKRRKSLEPLTEFDRPFIDIMGNCSKLTSLRLENIAASDSSLKRLQHYCPHLRELRIIHSTSAPVLASITDISLISFANLDALKFCNISYPNTITENGVIHYLLTAKRVNYLKVYDCKELIPVREIIEASIKTAKHRLEPIFVDIDTREKISISDAPRSLANAVPKNLTFKMATGVETWTANATENIEEEEEVDDMDALIYPDEGLQLFFE